MLISKYNNVSIYVYFRFCDLAVKHGMDIFRIFDSLNYFPNIKVGMEAVGNAGEMFSHYDEWKESFCHTSVKFLLN